MASNSSLLLCLGLWLLAHGPHAMRQSSYQDVLEDSMVCECKKVNSVKDCPDYKIKKDGFLPGYPRYYHDKAESGMDANLCCRMAPNETKSTWKKLTSPYVAEKNKEKCLEETRPFDKGGCCTLAGSTEVYGREFKIGLNSAKVYSMAHKKMLPSGNPTEKDYANKSNVFIEEKGILVAKTTGGKTIHAAELRSEMEGIKKLILKNGEDLQCKEDFVASMKNRGNTCRAPKPVCCCRPDYLNAASTTCKKSVCAPKENPVHLPSLGRKEVEDPRRPGVVLEYAPKWPDPFYRCKKRTLNLVIAQQLSNYSCTQSKWIRIPAERYSWGEMGPLGGIVDKFEDIPERAQELCVKAKFPLPCPAGEVKYERVRGWHVEGHQFSCPVGLKSNLPGDPEKDSRCQCDSSISLAELEVDGFFAWLSNKSIAISRHPRGV